MAVVKTSRAPGDVKRELCNIARFFEHHTDYGEYDGADAKVLLEYVKSLRQALSYRQLSKDLRHNGELADALYYATDDFYKLLRGKGSDLDPNEVVKTFKEASEKLLKEWK